MAARWTAQNSKTLFFAVCGWMYICTVPRYVRTFKKIAVLFRTLFGDFRLSC